MARKRNAGRRREFGPHGYFHRIASFDVEGPRLRAPRRLFGERASRPGDLPASPSIRLYGPRMVEAQPPTTPEKGPPAGTVAVPRTDASARDATAAPDPKPSQAPRDRRSDALSADRPQRQDAEMRESAPTRPASPEAVSAARDDRRADATAPGLAPAPARTHRRADAVIADPPDDRGDPHPLGSDQIPSVRHPLAPSRPNQVLNDVLAWTAGKFPSVPTRPTDRGLAEAEPRIQIDQVEVHVMPPPPRSARGRRSEETAPLFRGPRFPFGARQG